MTTVGVQSTSRDIMSDDDSIDTVKLFPKLPPTELGKFEICSGLIFLNQTFKEYSTIAKKRGQKRKLTAMEKMFVEVHLHEYYHFLQVISCGFIYEIQQSVFKRLLASKELRSIKFNEQPKDWKGVLPKFFKALNGFLQPLHAKPGINLSPFELMESAAFNFQVRGTRGIENHREYLTLINALDVPLEYTTAYRFATKCLGKDAFPFFLSTVSLALIYSNPVEAFAEILLRQKRIGVDNYFKSPGAHFKKLDKLYGYLGQSYEIHRKYEGKRSSAWYADCFKIIEEANGLSPAFWELTNLTNFPQPALCFLDAFRAQDENDRMKIAIRAIFASVMLNTLEPYIPHKSAAQFHSKNAL